MTIEDIRPFQELSRVDRMKLKDQIAEAAFTLVVQNNHEMYRRDLVNTLIDNGVHYNSSVVNFGVQVGIARKLFRCDGDDYIRVGGEAASADGSAIVESH